MQKWKLVIPLLAVLTCSCTFNDDERCMGDLYFDKEYGYCRVETPFDYAVTRAEGKDTGGGILNLQCKSNADCAGNGDLEFCLLGPDLINGVCTINKCTSADGCQSSDFMCIDCSAVAGMAAFFPYPVCGLAVYEEAFTDLGCITRNIVASDDTDSANPIGGVFMLECQFDADCANNGSMTYCLPNGLDATAPGNCVQDNCVPNACPVGQECCDCSNSNPGFGWLSPMCWDEAMNAGPYGLENYGCVCTPNTYDKNQDTDTSTVGVMDTDTSDTTVTDTDSTDTDTAVAAPAAGLVCTSDADCAANGIYDYCFSVFGAPSTESPGSCIQDACTSGSCEGAGQECCDCTAVGFIVWPSNLCMPEVMRIGDYGYETLGCTCD